MQDFMKDRYGADQLTIFLGAVGMVLALIGSLANLRPLSWIAIVVVVLALLRAFSKNADARRSENDMFLELTAKIPGVGQSIANMGANMSSGSASAAPSKDDFARAKRTAKKIWSKRKTSRFLKCPNCGQILSVPKGKGRILVTCPKCHAKMETKS